MFNHILKNDSNDMTFVKGFSDENKVKKMPYRFLGKTDLKISKISLGAGAFGGSKTYGEYDQKKATETVINSICSGINFIDGGPHYGLGLAETFLGTVLNRIPRNSYFISTKVGRCGNYFNFTSEAIIESFNQSLKRLQLDRVDIVFVHDIEFSDSLNLILNETLPTVEKFVQSGKARFIGISGYPLSVLLDVVNRSKIKIDCVLTYCRDTLIDNTLQDYIPLFQRKGVGIINAGCLSMGLLTNEGPPAWHPASQETKQICGSAAEYCKENIIELGRLALFYSLNQPGSDTYLIGMNDPSILQSNLDVLWNGLNDKELNVLKYFQEKYFPLNVKHHWEGTEIELCRNNLLK